MLVVFLAVIMSASAKTNFLNKLCILTVGDCVYGNLKVSDVILRRWGYFKQSYDLRFKMGKITVVMAGNGAFQQKSITQYRKTFITQPKPMVFC